MRGTLHDLTWKLGKHTKTGAPQWQAFKTIDAQNVKFVLDRDSTIKPTENLQRFLSVEGGVIHPGGCSSSRIILAKTIQLIREEDAMPLAAVQITPIDQAHRTRSGARTHGSHAA